MTHIWMMKKKTGVDIPAMNARRVEWTWRMLPWGSIAVASIDVCVFFSLSSFSMLSLSSMDANTSFLVVRYVTCSTMRRTFMQMKVDGRWHVYGIRSPFVRRINHFDIVFALNIAIVIGINDDDDFPPGEWVFVQPTRSSRTIFQIFLVENNKWRFAIVSDYFSLSRSQFVDFRLFYFQ